MGYVLGVPEVGVSVLGLGSLIVGRAVELFRLTLELLRLTVESLRFTVELLRFEVAYLRCAGQFARYGIEFTRRAITSAGRTFRSCGRLRLLADGVEFWRSTLAGDGNALQFLRKAQLLAGTRFGSSGTCLRSAGGRVTESVAESLSAVRRRDRLMRRSR